MDPTPLWDFSDPAGSEQRFRDAAATASGADRLIALTQAARALGLQERFAEGHALLDEVTSATPAGSPEVEARVALERGRLERSAGDPIRADPLFEEAARRAAAAGLEALHVDALHMLALDRPPGQSIERHLQALEVARAATDPAARRWQGSLLNNLGMAHHDAGDLASALAVFEEAVLVRERDGSATETRVARWMVGWTLRLLGRTQEALATQLALKAELDDAGADDPYVDEELAALRGT